MKIAFVSNFLSHHQIPFCDEMFKMLGDDFTFISFMPMDDQRKELGWEINKSYTYELKAYISNPLLQRAMSIIDSSDVVIIGSAPDHLIKKRLKENKLTFKYSERLYKGGLNLKNFPRAVVSSWLHHGRFQKHPLFMLCASAFTKVDVSLFGNYKQRTFKWGYFPEFKEHNITQLLKQKPKNSLKILWVGRFIKWKFPEHALYVAECLRNKKINFELTMIGSGEELGFLRNLVETKGLGDLVKILKPMKPEDIREQMVNSNIFLFTSDFNEGWGAVLNESMNSGCAIAASHAIGAVPFLMIHEENGLIYKNGDIVDLCNKVLILAQNTGVREKLGRNAYLTIKHEWNAKVAAERFIKLASCLLDKLNYIYESGPCSKAEVIKNDWFIKEV